LIFPSDLAQPLEYKPAHKPFSSSSSSPTHRHSIPDSNFGSKPFQPKHIPALHTLSQLYLRLSTHATKMAPNTNMSSKKAATTTTMASKATTNRGRIPTPPSDSDRSRITKPQHATKQQRDREATQRDLNRQAAIEANLSEFTVFHAKKREKEEAICASNTENWAAEQSDQEKLKAVEKAASERRWMWGGLMWMDWEQAGVPEMKEWARYRYRREYEGDRICA
jgi:hypothetical protein